APRDLEGRATHAHLHRGEVVRLDSADAPTFSMYTDGVRAALSVRDPFGSLDPMTVQQYLAKCAAAGPDQIDTKEGGAGLGVYFAYRSLSHFVINIIRGRVTEVGGIIDLRKTTKDSTLLPKTFCIFCFD